MLKTDYIHTYRQTLQNLITAHGDGRVVEGTVEFGQSVAIVVNA